MPPRSNDVAFRLMHHFLSATRAQRPSAQQSLCFQCRTHLRQSLRLAASAPTRSFSSTLPSQKKSSGSPKSNRKSPSLDSLTNKSDPPIPDNKATRTRDAELDPYDFSELDSGIAKAVARLKDALVKTKDAGRVTPEMIEQLPVEVNVKDAETGRGTSHKEKVKVGDLASVVAKGGRSVNVFCAEEAHVKPLLSALQASSYSLAPQASTDSNPLLITVPVPPTTAETRNLAKQEAKKMFERASSDVRNARGDAQKRFRKMELGKLVIVDELRKAHKQMEELVRKAQDEIRKVYEGSLKALDG